MTRSILLEAADRWRPIKAAASVLALTGLVLGIPLALIEIGGMPFSHTGLAQLTRTVGATHPGDPRVAAYWIAGAALVLAWSVWVWMTLCVVIELRSWVTGRTARRLPASRTAQSVAAFLVGTTLAVSALGRGAPTHPMRAVTVTPLTHSPVSDPTDDDVVPIADLMTAEPSTSHGYRAPVANSSEPSPRTVAPVSAEWPERPSDGPGPSLEEVGLFGPVIRAGQRDRADRACRANQASQADPANQVGPVHPVASAEPASRRPPLRHEGRHEAGPDLPLRDATNTGTFDPRTVPLEPTTPGATSPAVAPLAVPRTHLVRSRETLWSIAQDELGSALRWNELAELNYGITQMDGRALDEGHWVMPGWRLLLPPVGTPTGPVTRSVAPPGSARGRSGLVGGGTARAVDLGLRRALTPGPSSGTAHRFDSAPGSVGGGGPEPGQMPVPPVAPLGAGVVGAGVVRWLDRLRRVQQRYRPEGAYIRLPDAGLSEFEQRLRIGDGWVIPLEVDSAVRQVAESLSETGERPQVLGVRFHEDVIEIVMADSGRPMEVTDRSTTASTVSTARRVAGRPGLESAAAPGPRALAPMLVTVGRDASGPVMVNLEALGSLVVSGDQAEADAVVRALALELSTSFWAGQFSLAVVGFGSELERFQGVRSFPVGTELLDSLSRRRLNGADLLRTAGYASFAQARLTEDSDRWSPLAVICGPAVPDADVAEILEAATDPVHGTTVVAVGHRSEAQYSVRLTGGGWASSLELLGSVAFPQRIEADELGKVSALLDTATSRQSVLSSEEPYVSLPIQLPRTGNGSPVLTSLTGPDPHGTSDSHGPTSQASTASAAHTSVGGAGASSPEVEVAVLGPIEIRGAARSFSRAWAEELVVYLAMHPNGASNEAWATALWPDRLMAPSSLHSTASVARRSLGQSTKGTDHLPRSHGRLVLAPTVGTDWDRFVALSESDRPEQWRAALTLVRGRPFEGLRCSDWPILEGIAPAIEAAVVDLSGRLAGACLQLRDAQGAEWAARRGLVVSPYDERLYRMLMRAADAGGNPAGVDALMSELLALVADGIEPIDAVHPKTMELYRQLSRRGRYRAPRV